MATDTVRVVVEVPTADAAAIAELLPELRAGDHGVLDLPRLAELWLSDVAVFAVRPESWETAAVYQLLCSHGY